MKRILVLVCLLASAAPALADTESDARALLDAWVAAQTARDFAAYTALYAPKFVGIRRTADGTEKRMKLKAWKTDRKKMFKLKKVEVVADSPVVKATDAGATITFVQRWRGGGYADHGTKVLTLAAGASGALAIVGEELLSSTPGWEDDPSATFDATAMTTPITLRLKALRVGPADQGGCNDVMFVLYVKDKAGTTTQREIGTGYVDPDEDGFDEPSTRAMSPSTTSGLLYEVGVWCAGDGEYHEVKRSGDAVIVRSRYEGEGVEPSPWATTFTLQLPHAAKVKAK